MDRFLNYDWASCRVRSFNIFTKLIRTKDPAEEELNQEVPPTGRHRLSRCLTTLDLTSLGVGSCVGTGMYLVAGMVTRKYAGPGVIFSFVIAALASIFSGACYAEFGVRVPHTTGSAYSYTYVTVGEFIAYVIGWNMVLEYLIGSSACARALSASCDSLFDGQIANLLAFHIGTIYGKPPDVVACSITILMTLVLIAGVKKSIVLTNVLNAINLSVWVFIMAAGLFYMNTDNWTEHKGFLPYGWSGVFTGAATCFYAFIGFDIIATTGEEANNPKRSIPLAIVLSLAIILGAYVTSSMMLTLMVPYDEVDTDSALVQMFAYVHAPICKYIVAVGAVSGLTVSMFGSMFPMPRVMYAMAKDGLVFRQLAVVNPKTGTPTLATISGGIAASVVALFVQLEVLVEMMSIGTLLAYTLVSTCVLVLRYQPRNDNLIELLPPRLRTPIVEPTSNAVTAVTAASERETSFITGYGGASQSHIVASNQRVMVRRVTRSSPDSDDTLPGDDSEEYGRDDTFLVSDRNETKFYGTIPNASSSGGTSRFAVFFDAICYRLHRFSYLCPGLFPWVDCGPATEESGLYVIKAVGVMYVLIVTFNICAVCWSPESSTFMIVFMVFLVVGIIIILLLISRKPENRADLVYAAPALPFVPAVAITVNIYLILNLSILTLVRFTVWMALGLVVYFKYGIKNSTLEQQQRAAAAPEPPRLQPTVLDRTTIPPAPPAPDTSHHRNIFEGDGSNHTVGLYANDGYVDPLLAWDRADNKPTLQVSSTVTFKQIEQRYDEKTNKTTSHASGRPPWANSSHPFPTWDD